MGSFTLEPTAIGTGALALTLILAFVLTYLLTRRATRAHPPQLSEVIDARHLPLSSAPPSSSSKLSRSGSQSSIPQFIPYSAVTSFSAGTGTTLIATPDAEIRKADHIRVGVYRGPFARQHPDYGSPGRGRELVDGRNHVAGPASGRGKGYSTKAKGWEKRPPSGMTDGGNSVVVITYEQGLAELGIDAVPPLPALGKSKRMPSIVPSSAGVRVGSKFGYPQPSTVQTARSTATTPTTSNGTVLTPSPQVVSPRIAPTPSTASLNTSIGFGSAFKSALPSASRSIEPKLSSPPVIAVQTAPVPPRRPSRPSIVTTVTAPSEPEGFKSPVQSSVSAPREPISALPFSEAGMSDDMMVREREMKGRDGLKGRRDRKQERERQLDDWLNVDPNGTAQTESGRDENRMTFDGPQSAWLPSYYLADGDKRKTRTRGGRI